jgi:photosystem II stability/assembly factor-like uncharacterized protein
MQLKKDCIMKIVSVTFLLIMVLTPRWSEAEWVHLSGELITALAEINNKILAGSYNCVYISEDNGSHWTKSISGLPSESTILSFATIDSTIFACSYIGGVFISSDEGKNWSSANNGLPIDSFFVTDMLLTDGNKIYAGTDNGVYITSDKATNWNPINSGIKPYTHVMSLAIDTDMIWFYNNYYNSIFYSTNKGSSWTETHLSISSLERIDALCFQDNFLLAGTNIGILRSVNNGETWFYASSGLPANTQVHTLFTFDKNIVAGTNFGAFITSDCGSSWKAINSELSSTDIYSFTLSEKYLFAGTSDGVWRLPLSVVTANKKVDCNHQLSLNINASSKLNSNVEIAFSIPNKQNVTLSIFNLHGDRVVALANKLFNAGTHKTMWNPGNIAPGAYTAQIHTRNVKTTKLFSLVH